MRLARSVPLLSALLALAAANALLWTFSTPFNQAPDEGAHFQVVRFIRDYGRLPVFSPEELWLIDTPKGWVETYAAFPPLAYIVAAGAAQIVGGEPLWGARLVSAAAYLGTICLTYLIARRLFPPREGTALVAAALVAFLPQFAFTAAYVNNDALAAAESAALIYVLVRLADRPRSTALSFAAGVLMGLILLTKYTFYPVAVLGTGVALGLALRGGQDTDSPGVDWGRSLARVARGAASLSTAAALTAGWWFVRSWQLYGELAPSQVVAAAKEAAGGNTLFVPAEYGITLLSLSTETDFWPLTLKSFVASFGFLSIYLDGGYYWGVAGLLALAAIGLVLRPKSRPLSAPGWGRESLPIFVVGAAGLVAATLGSAMAISAFGEYSPQGRYLFGALVPLAVAVSAGWGRLADAHAMLRPLPAVGALCFAVLNGLSLFGYVVPAHFGPQPDVVFLQVDRPRGPQPAGAPIEVAGWGFAQGPREWQPFFPENVLGYRRPIQGVVAYLDGPPGQGKFVGTAHYGFRRRDVSDFYGGVDRIERIGYRLELPASLLAAGTHHLYVCAIVETLLAPTCAGREVRVE